MGRAVSHSLDPDVGGSTSNLALCPLLPPSGRVVLAGQRAPCCPCDPAPSPGGGGTLLPQRRVDTRQPRALPHQGRGSCRAVAGGPFCPPWHPALHAPSASGPPGNTQGTDTPHSWGLSYMSPVQRGDGHQPHTSDVGAEPDGGAVTTGSQQDAQGLIR